MFNINYSKRCVKVLAIVLVLMCVSACESLDSFNKKLPKQESNVLTLCDTSTQYNQFLSFCEFQHWMRYRITIQEFPWSQRRSMIDELEDDPLSLLKKALLSQGIDTPYQNRLRAQSWLLALENQVSPAMHMLLIDIIYENSQQLLEFESAITILSGINTRQEQQIAALRNQVSLREEEIKQQGKQVDQLLKIELDLSQRNKHKPQYNK